MTTCTKCQHWQLKKSKLAHHGFATCALDAPWGFMPAQATCEQHLPATPEIANAREAWLLKLSGIQRKIGE